jgi:hypothetical protein
VTGAAVVLVAAVALAAQVNTYSVTASTSPPKQGSKKKPVAEGLAFNYTVGEASGQRPAPSKHYKLFLTGLVFHGEAFPTCTADQINGLSPPSDSVCRVGALVGSGDVENIAGATANPADKSLKCHLDLKIYNAGRYALALYLKGGANPDPAKACPLTISQAIPAVLTRTGAGTSLEFDVASNLRHPVPNIDNSVVQVASSLPVKTAKAKKASASKKKGKKKKAKKIGYIESVGGCTGGKRKVSVEFTSETGQVVATSTDAPCRK